MADVVVVGASVAGAATAVHLARLGHAVQLIDRAQFPRRKACGEGLFSPGVRELDRLGVLDGLLPRARMLSGLRFHLGHRSATANMAQASHPVVGIQRDLLDEALIRLAVASGVDVHLGMSVHRLLDGTSRYLGVQTDQGHIEAKVIVAADGAQSRLRRQASLDTARRSGRYGVSAHFETSEELPPQVNVHFRDGHEIYVTPVAERMANVAVLLNREPARRLGGRLREAYCELVTASGALPSGAGLIDEPLAAGPFPAQAKRAWRANLVLVGDATGFFDGVTGEGMSLALVSARLGATAIDAYLQGEGERAFAKYHRQRHALARNSELLGRFVLALAAHPKLGAWAVSNMARRPRTFEHLIAINQGERGLTSLRPWDLTALLFGV